MNSRIRKKMAFDSEDEALGMIWKQMDEALKKCQIPDDLKNRTGLVLDELLTNICAYGRGDDPNAEAMAVQVDMKIEDDLKSLRLMVTDSGIPFNPLTVLESDADPSDEEGGMGLRLVREWSEDLQYEYRDGRNHLEVLLRDRED